MSDDEVGQNGFELVDEGLGGSSSIERSGQDVQSVTTLPHRDVP